MQILELPKSENEDEEDEDEDAKEKEQEGKPAFTTPLAFCVFLPEPIPEETEEPVADPIA